MIKTKRKKKFDPITIEKVLSYRERLAQRLAHADHVLAKHDIAVPIASRRESLTAQLEQAAQLEQRAAMLRREVEIEAAHLPAPEQPSFDHLPPEQRNGAQLRHRLAQLGLGRSGFSSPELSWSDAWRSGSTKQPERHAAPTETPEQRARREMQDQRLRQAGLPVQHRHEPSTPTGKPRSLAEAAGDAFHRAAEPTPLDKPAPKPSAKKPGKA